MRVRRIGSTGTVPMAPERLKSGLQKVRVMGNIDVFLPRRRDVLRRAVADIESRIKVKQAEVVLAEQRRTMARRLAVAMSVVTVVSSVVTLVLTLGPMAPVGAALWVVPSALGGSAVSQSVVAIRESEVIRRLRCDVSALQAVHSELSAELRAINDMCEQP